MASSKKPKPENGSPPRAVSAKTPGVLGLLDGADPNVVACLGDTPGPLGLNDYAQPPWRAFRGSGCLAAECHEVSTTAR